MRIAYDHQIFSLQRFGGISRYFFELASNLSNIDQYKSNYRVISPIYINEYIKLHYNSIDIDGVWMPSIRYTGRAVRAFNQMLAPFLLGRWGPDILHETYYARRSVAPKGCRRVLTVFDMIHELYPESFRSWDPTTEEKRIAVARADHVICISESTRRDLVRLFGVPVEKTSVVYLGFGLDRQEPAILPAPRRPFFLFVGLRGGYKNFDRLVSAYAACSKLRNEYDLVAFGGGGFSSKERDMILSHGLGEQVHQQGGDDSVLSALYRQAALFVYPSLYEGFGIPPLEAMSLDCPVVCSNTSSIPEVVGDAAVQFDPNDVESIGSALRSVAFDPQCRAELRLRGQSRIAEFSWRKCAMETLDVYQKVLA